MIKKLIVSGLTLFLLVLCFLWMMFFSKSDDKFA